MTQDDIVKVARECGIGLAYGRESIERFYTFVAAAEREACAKVTEDIDIVEFEHCMVVHQDAAKTLANAAAAIRARGET